MKKLTLFTIAVLSAICVMAQAPQKMSYQAIIRNAANNLIVNSTVGMQISILKGSASGTAVYVETQTPTTNANGLISIEIGNGTVVSGTVSSIDWAEDIYYVKTETDPAGGTSYTISGTSQLLSVPYALYAQSAGSNAYAQLQRTTGYTSNTSAWTPIVFEAMPVGKNISFSGSDISFSKPGTYKISCVMMGYYQLGSGSNEILAIRLYGDGAVKAVGNWTTFLPNNYTAGHSDFLVNITNTAATYRIEMGRWTTAPLIFYASTVNTQAVPGIKAIIEKID